MHSICADRRRRGVLYHRKAIEALESRAPRLVAVADPFMDRLEPDKSRLAARGVAWHTDYHELLDSAPDLDAVVIATPIPFHYEMTMACLARVDISTLRSRLCR